MARFDEMSFPLAEPIYKIISESIHEAMKKEGKDFLITMQREVEAWVKVSSPKQEEKHEMIYRHFTYHPPKASQLRRYERIRELARNFAHELVDLTPDSPEQQKALELLHMVTMMANASIACNEI